MQSNTKDLKNLIVQSNNPNFMLQFDITILYFFFKLNDMNYQKHS